MSACTEPPGAQVGQPTHAARQLPAGRWTSKLGQREDIEHDLHALGGSVYGAVAQVFKRPIEWRRGNW